VDTVHGSKKTKRNVPTERPKRATARSHWRALRPSKPPSRNQNKNLPNESWGWFSGCYSPSTFVTLPAAEQKHPATAIERGRAGKQTSKRY
jgi:hypothetical protein